MRGGEGTREARRRSSHQDLHDLTTLMLTLAPPILIMLAGRALRPRAAFLDNESNIMPRTTRTTTYTRHTAQDTQHELTRGALGVHRVVARKNMFGARFLLLLLLTLRCSGTGSITTVNVNDGGRRQAVPAMVSVLVLQGMCVSLVAWLVGV
ncbi:hypothetical protein C8Q79DRAFT_16243 [Trametes meyenii]|nr:hypothetical protein C8Q79DRAFT_16243 [Trametes meyenii]